jgi:hypothetical protein
MYSQISYDQINVHISQICSQIPHDQINVHISQICSQIPHDQINGTYLTYMYSNLIIVYLTVHI